MKKIYFGTIFILLSFFSTSIFAEDFDLRHSYAVVWTIDSEDSELFNNTVAEQSASLLDLWQKGVIENVYFDNKITKTILKKGERGKIMFFIKTKTEAEANEFIDEMPFVKKKIATYELYPVGFLWLKQF